MAKEHETIADIIAEMFDRADKLEHNKLGQVFADSFAKLHREYASRVDAAAKRMEWAHKKELEARDAVIQTEVAAREAERDAHKREMKETVRRVSQVAKEMTRGTAKGVAPTMKDVDEWAVRLYDTIDITLLAPARNCDRFNSGDAAKLREALVEARKVIKAMYWAKETLPIIDAALDAPPRNCDRFGTDNVEASLAYEEFCDRAEVEESVNGAIAWLLTLVAEKEGGAK